MNFTLRPIITITTLSKILGAFNAVFSLRRDLSQISCQEGGISSSIIEQYSTHGPPSPNECVCMSECTICKSWCWVIERGGSTLSVDVGMCVINPYKRGSIVSTAVSSDLSSNQRMLCLQQKKKKQALLVSFLYYFSLLRTKRIIPAVSEQETKR